MSSSHFFFEIQIPELLPHGGLEYTGLVVILFRPQIKGDRLLALVTPHP